MARHITHQSPEKYSGFGNFNAFWKPEDETLEPITQDVRALYFDEDGCRITTVEYTTRTR